jgi:hypothetical protein
VYEPKVGFADAIATKRHGDDNPMIKSFTKTVLSIWPFILVTIPLAMMFIVPEVILLSRMENPIPKIQMTSADTQLMLVSILILAADLIVVLVLLIRLRINRAILHVAALSLLVLAFLHGFKVQAAVKYASLYLVPKLSKHCSSTAKRYGENSSFKICNARDDGSSYAMLIYDSGEEVALPADRRSKQFESALNYTAETFLACPIDLQPLTKSFYFVRATCPGQ